jgi:hypothetical protein
VLPLIGAARFEGFYNLAFRPPAAGFSRVITTGQFHLRLPLLRSKNQMAKKRERYRNQ